MSPHENPSLSVHRAPVNWLGALPEVHILPISVGGRIGPRTEDIRIASYLSLCFRLITDHVPRDNEKEKSSERLNYYGFKFVGNDMSIPERSSR